MKRFKVFSGSFGIAIAQRACADPTLNLPLGRCRVERFSDGEVDVEFLEEVRGEQVYIIQPLISADAIVELGVMADAACRSSSHEIIAVIPYFGYMRQERKTKPRVPISAKWVVDMLINSGVDRIMTVDLHSGAIQGFVSARNGFDNLYAGMAICDAFAEHYKNIGLNIKSDVFSVAPDNGSADRTRALSDRFGIDKRIIVDKKRTEKNVSKVMNIIGDFSPGQRGINIG